MNDKPPSRLVYWIHLCGGALCIALILGTDFRPLDAIRSYLAPSGIFVFAAAALEAIYLIGFYFPGTFLILGVLLSSSCSVAQSTPLLLAVWLGSTAGLLVSFAAGRVIGARTDQSSATQWRSLWVPWMIGFHPNAAGSYIFHRAALASLSPAVFVKVALSGMAFLALYGWLVCVAGEHLAERQQDASVVWAGLIMLVGLFGLLRPLSRRITG